MINTADADAAAADPRQRPPVTVAGGWGNLNVAPRTTDADAAAAEDENDNGGEADDGGTFVDEEHQEDPVVDEDPPTKPVGGPDGGGVEGVEGCCARKALFMEDLERRIPRAYNVFFKVLLPVFLIIPVAILCGYFLARIEAPAERAANDAAMADYLTNYGRVQDLVVTLESKKRECEESFFGGDDGVGEGGEEVVTLNVTEYRAHVRACDLRTLNETLTIKKGLEEYLIESMTGKVTFNWITCEGSKSDVTFDYLDGRGPIKIYENLTRVESDQLGYFTWTWFFDFVDKWGQYAEESGEEPAPTMNEIFGPYGAKLDTDTASLKRATADARGAEQCETNIAGGAIFWWTIMTTIGYGNTAPTTGGGRALVYTLGFVTILAFTAIIAQAGYVTLAVFDDLFVRLRLKRLATGWISVLFWLSMMVLWFLVVAAIMMRRTVDKYGPENAISFKDAFWYSFITGTTVGLGDFHIQHDLVIIADMFYIPLVVLGSFVLLSNFLFKLSNVLMPYFEEGEELHAILEKTRTETAEPAAERGMTEAAETRAGTLTAPPESYHIGSCKPRRCQFM